MNCLLVGELSRIQLFASTIKRLGCLAQLRYIWAKRPTSNIWPLGGMTIAYRPIWLEHCGCVRHTYLPIASSDHVIRSIGRFKLVIDLRQRNLFLTWPCGTCFKVYSTAENIIIVSLNTVIPNIVIVKLGKVTWCLHKRIIYSHPVLATFLT